MKDRRAIFRALRRLSSARAAAFLEFCMIAPILVMFCSGIFEFVQLWDAKIMANHAAWTVGRIASVHAGLSTSPDAVQVTKGMKFATAALMSTATMGIGGDAAKASPGWLSGPLRSDISRLSSGLQLSGADGQMSAVVEKFPKNFLIELFGPDVGRFLNSLFSSSVAALVDECIDAVKTGLWQPVLRQWRPAATMSDVLRACQTHGVEDGDRQLRQMGVAQQLVNRTVGGRPVLSVAEGQTSPFVLSKSHSLSGDTGLDFPRCLDETAQFDTWRVMQDSGWPPKGAAQRMILVAVSWPFERAWLYPIFSREKWSGKDPVAVGESIAYPQPKISNANLRSVGAEAYKRDPVPEIPKEFGDLKDRYINYLKTAAFAITYRLGHELIGAHDANDKGGSHTHKGLGLMPVKPSQRTAIERRFGNHRSPWIWDVSENCIPTNQSSMARDGLCYWMDRAKLPPPPRDDPWNLKLTSEAVWDAWQMRDGHYKDYLWCWRSVAIVPYWGTGYDKDVLSGDSERWLFHSFGARQWIFLHINDYERVHANDWFHWGKETGDVLKFKDGSEGPREREQHLHLRHRKTKTLEDVINRRYEDTYLSWRIRNLEKSYAIYTDFENCRENSLEFFGWFDPTTGRQQIRWGCFNQDTWNKYNEKARNDNRFYPTVKHVVDSILCDYPWRRDAFLHHETELKKWTREAVAQYDKMIRLLEEEQSELERTIFGGVLPTPGKGDGNIWDFGIDERDVQKDPKKALKNMDEAIKKKKAESMAILYGVTDRIGNARSARIHGLLHEHLPKWPFDSTWRQQIVANWVTNAVEVLKVSPNLGWNDHMAKVRQIYADFMCTGADGRKFPLKEDIGRTLVDTSRWMEESMHQFHDVIADLYIQEREYGLKLGLSAAKEAKRRDERPIKPDKPGDWPPKPPKPPSRGPGSDDDALGDGWQLEGSDKKRGWQSFTDGGWKP